MLDPLGTSGLVVVDKPKWLTSHDVVARLRKAFHTRSVGHAGTLDPMATGVLVVGVERGTKFLAHLVAATKSYTATIRLGVSTETDDTEGEPIAAADPADVAALDLAAVDAAAEEFRGTFDQVPAKYSALKIGGRSAHELLRRGREVDLPARRVTISRLELSDARPGDGVVDVDAEVSCSTGTYIRALARDLGNRLGVGGHLTALRRTSVGAFGLDDAIPLAELEEAERPRLSLSIDEALTCCYPTLEITEEEGDMLATGKWLEPRGVKGTRAAVTPSGRAVALVKESGKRLASTFVARPVTLMKPSGKNGRK